MLLPLKCLELRLLPKGSNLENIHGIQIPSPRRSSNLCLLRSLRYGAVHHRSRSSHASQTKDGIAERASLLDAVRTVNKDCSASPSAAASSSSLSKQESLFYFDAGYALFAKRPSRPFPSPFSSGQSESFSDRSRGNDQLRNPEAFKDGRKHAKNKSKNVAGSGTGVGGKADTGIRKELAPELMKELKMIKGVTNGDDAVLASERFIGANDGVGAWATKENGHAALWSRLIIHFWALEAEKDNYGTGNTPNPVMYLQQAFNKVKEATSTSNPWLGTTTACGALLSTSLDGSARPIIYATHLGDSGILILRPEDKSTLYKSAGQWHWFDCPRQLGTNSPDVPEKNAVTECIEIQEGDVVLAVTDGVLDNLWDHEVAERVFESLKSWKENEEDNKGDDSGSHATDGRDKMRYVARELVNAARDVAEDPFAESPYMEKAIEEGITIEGGKLDDISVVAAQCRQQRNPDTSKT